jgi:hypothetical protein
VTPEPAAETTEPTPAPVTSWPRQDVSEVVTHG